MAIGKHADRRQRPNGVGADGFLRILCGILKVLDDLLFVRSIVDHSGGNGPLVGFGGIPQHVAQLIQVAGGKRNEPRRIGPGFRIGHHRMARREVLRGIAPPGRPLDCSHELPIGVAQILRQSGRARGLRMKLGMRRARLLDPDQQGGSGTLAAHRRHAPHGHARDLLDGVLQGTLRGRQRVARLDVEGVEDVLRGDPVEPVEIDFADYRRLGGRHRDDCQHYEISRHTDQTRDTPVLLPTRRGFRSGLLLCERSDDRQYDRLALVGRDDQIEPENDEQQPHQLCKGRQGAEVNDRKDNAEQDGKHES